MTKLTWGNWLRYSRWKTAVSVQAESADRFIDDYRHLVYMIFMVFFVAPPLLLGKVSAVVRVDGVSDMRCTYLFALRRETALLPPARLSSSIFTLRRHKCVPSLAT